MSDNCPAHQTERPIEQLTEILENATAAIPPEYFQLQIDGGDPAYRARTTDPSPLLGKLFDETGVPLTPSHAVKSGRRYRYYVSRRLISGKGAESNDRQGWRLPAQEIERTVGDAVMGLLADRATLTDAARKSGIEAKQMHGLLNAVSKWRGKALDIVERVDLRDGEFAIDVSLRPMSGETDVVVRHVVPTQIKRRGVELRLVLQDASVEAARPNPALIKAVARARKWFDDLLSGHAKSLGDIARAEAVTDRYVSHLMQLAFLAPEIVDAVLGGTQTVDLTVEKLTKHMNLPLGWVDQKTLTGFDYSAPNVRSARSRYE